MAEELHRLVVETTCNTGDKELLANLNSARDRGLPKLLFEPAHKRSLVICGSGPSLRDYLAVVSLDCDFMALNGAYGILLDAGIPAKYFAMLDARAANLNFLELIHPDTQFLLAPQCHPDIFDALEGRNVTLFHLNTPTNHKVFPGEPIYLGGGGTIGLTAIAIGAALGYRHITLLGYDSSYRGAHSHARYQEQNAGQATLPVWIEDREYLSTPAMAQQVMDFFPWHAALQKAFPGLIIDVVGEGLFYDYVVTNNKAPTRESEAAKYVGMYEEENYRMPAHRLAGIRDLLFASRGSSLLDVGTGRGETLMVAREAGFTVVRGTETVAALLNEHVEKALLPNLPFPDASYDVVTSFEVIEHLLPEDVVPALHELARVARERVIFSVATCSDMRSGIELHPSARPEPEWDSLITGLWGEKVRKVGNLSSCGLSPVYEYVK